MVTVIASLIGSRALKKSSQIRCTLVIISSGSVLGKREWVTYILDMSKLIIVRYNEPNKCTRHKTHLKASLLRQSASFKLSRVCFLKTTFIQCRTWKIWSCFALLRTIRWLSSDKKTFSWRTSNEENEHIDLVSRPSAKWAGGKCRLCRLLMERELDSL